MDSARVSVRVHPGARHDELSAVRGGLLQAGVTATDAGEAANRAVIALLARRLHVPPEQVTIVSGHALRVKQIRVDGVDQPAVDARLGGLAPVRRLRRRRAAAGALAALVVVIVAVVLFTGGSSPAPGSGAASGDGGVPIAAAATSASTGTGRAHHHRAAHRRGRRARRGVDPGTLPQTAQRPDATTRAFAARMHGLWAAITGRPAGNARAAFFPRSAYVQLKAVADPAGDFTDRLYADYRLDIDAAHALLGTGAGTARLVSTAVVAADAHWVPPHVCANTSGYWEMPNARLVYRESGQVRSIGIASMISWRGVWYVIHLGAIVRHTAGGIVDAPASGSGTSVPSSAC